MKRYKPNKQLFYLRGFGRLLIPRRLFMSRLAHRLASLDQRPDKDYILDRVDYYNRLSAPFVLPPEATRLDSLSRKTARTMYYLDASQVARWFDGGLRWMTAFGDVNYVAAHPSVTKSRPLGPDNANNVLLKLNRYRHFNFIRDPYPTESKQDKAVFRADIGTPDVQSHARFNKQNRIEFMRMYFGSDCCDCGSIRNRPGLPSEWITPRLSIGEHLRYKYILALEGDDVASNLKWIMSSNSLAVTPRPTCETWFMEGRLVPDYHYVEIRPDFADLPERMAYYSAHPDEAAAIVRHAHEWCDQFRDEAREELIGLLVLHKYFTLSGQL